MNEQKKGRHTVLVVTATQSDAAHICETLGEDTYNFITATSGIDALSSITYQLPSIIISEVDLPGMNGHELCKKIRTGIKTKLIPFIFISNSDTADDRITAFQTGADAYLSKPFNTDELRALVASKIQIFNEFYQISITDELTRLYTRREFIKQFNTEIENSQNQVSSLCIIDLDHFKKINDTFGHQMGDLVLMKFADILKSRASDAFFPARFGGEEFVILMPGTGATAAKNTVDSLRYEFSSLEFRHTVDGTPFNVSFSAGVAEYPSMASNISELLSRADQALYTVKKEGRGKTYIFRAIMSRNDRFWEYLKPHSGTFVEPVMNDPVTKLPFLPQILEQIRTLDYDVKSIGILFIRVTPLFDIDKLRGIKNLFYDLENIKNILQWTFENSLPSDMYLAKSSFFDHEYVTLFPSIVDFSYNLQKFNDVCRDVSLDLFLYIINYFFDISFSNDIIFYDRNNPYHLLDDISAIRGRIKLLDNKKDFFVNIINSTRNAVNDEAALDQMFDYKYCYSLHPFEPSFQFFTSSNFIIKTDFTDILLKKIAPSAGDFDRFARLLSDSFNGSPTLPLLFQWVPAIDLQEYINIVHAHFRNRETIVLINEKQFENIRIEHINQVVEALPECISLGLDNCYIGNTILNLLSTVDFRVALFSENIIRNIHRFPERIKIINGLKLFADQVGLPIIAKNILIEEEFQILKDLKISHASGPYMDSLLHK